MVKPENDTTICYLDSWSDGLLPKQPSPPPPESPELHDPKWDELRKRRKELYVLQPESGWRRSNFIAILPKRCHPSLNRWYLPTKNQNPERIYSRCYSLWVGIDLDKFQAPKTPDDFFKVLELAVSSGHFSMSDRVPFIIDRSNPLFWPSVSLRYNVSTEDERKVNEFKTLDKGGEEWETYRVLEAAGKIHQVDHRQARESRLHRAFWMEMYGYFGNLYDAEDRNSWPAQAAKKHIRLLRQLFEMGEIDIVGEYQGSVGGHGIDLSPSGELTMFGTRLKRVVMSDILIFPALTFGPSYYPKGKEWDKYREIVGYKPDFEKNSMVTRLGNWVKRH
ncbi:hypothetical protein N7456_009688 [Penicillium angulare]|uniref:Uncharacterized protein n=1 Tax=Penicillium angulare TaxID=116970 RepID=A0A9W9K6D6_9EURO|nr:hypothetical protein N7456_009688 [Penicillium angulare]